MHLLHKDRIMIFYEMLTNVASDLRRASGNLMKATLAAVQLQVRLLARLVKNILANSPARIIGNVAAALFGVLTLFQTEEKLGFVARSAGFVEIVCGTGQSAGCTTRWILSKTATSSTHPILVPLELYKSLNISVFYGNICCTVEYPAYHLTSCSRKTKNPTEKKGFKHKER